MQVNIEIVESNEALIKIFLTSVNAPIKSSHLYRIAGIVEGVMKAKDQKEANVYGKANDFASRLSYENGKVYLREMLPWEELQSKLAKELADDLLNFLKQKHDE